MRGRSRRTYWVFDFGGIKKSVITWRDVILVSAKPGKYISLQFNDDQIASRVEYRGDIVIRVEIPAAADRRIPDMVGEQSHCLLDLLASRDIPTPSEIIVVERRHITTHQGPWILHHVDTSRTYSAQSEMSLPDEEDND